MTHHAATSHTSYPIKPWIVISSVTLAWIVLLVTALFSRPLLAVDETRYVGVAWEMWLHHHYLVPYLVNQPYADKPPLLFWLILGGWQLFGVNDWWPRLLPPLFGYLCAGLTFLIAKKLWPQQTIIHLNAWVILLGALPWCLYANMLLFDIVLSFCVLLALYGLLITYLHNHSYGWLYFILGVSCGLLTKGPVILMFTLPLALLLPYIIRQNKQQSQHYYAFVALGYILSILLALCWAIPAAIQAGSAYTTDIFIAQSIGRLIKTHSTIHTHSHNLWWYAYFIPFYFMPWVLYPSLWRAAFSRSWQKDPSLKFLIVSISIIFIIMSLTRGKQIHYLLPLIPLCSLVFACWLSTAIIASSRSLWIFNSAVILLGLLLACLPMILSSHVPATFVHNFTALPAYLIIGYGVLLFMLRPVNFCTAQLSLSLSSVLLLAIINVLVIHNFYTFYSIKPIASYLGKLQRAGHPIAITGTYHAQYQFLGRLPTPIQPILVHNMATWAQQHPNGWIIIKQENFHNILTEPDALFNYQTKKIAVIAGKALVIATQPINTH